MKRTHALVLTLWGALIPSLARASECTVAVSPQGLGMKLQGAETAFGNLDVDSFTTTMDAAAFDLPCVDAPIGPDLAARYHRLMGLRQYVARSEERAAQAFAAARQLDPDHELSPALVPEGHLVRGLYGQFPLENGTFDHLYPPLEGSLLLDGLPAEQRPSAWPTWVQLLDEDGRPTQGAYLFPGDAMPSYEAEVPAPRGPIAALPFIRNKTQLWLASGSLLSAAGAGTLYALGSVSAQRFEQDQPTYGLAELEAHQRRTNGLLVGAGALATVALGTGVTASVSGKW